MTEYDFSPEAVSRYHAKMASINEWTHKVSDTAQRGTIGPPPTPLVRRNEIDDSREVAQLRHWEKDLRKEREREKKEREKERERLKEQARKEKSSRHREERDRDRHHHHRDRDDHDHSRRSKSHGHRSERSRSRERDRDRDRPRETGSKKSGAHREPSRHHRDKRSQTVGPYSNSSQSTRDVNSTQSLPQPAPQQSSSSLPVYHRHTLSHPIIPPHAIPNPPPRHASASPPPPPRAQRPQTARSRTTPHPLSHQIQFIQPPTAVHRTNTAPVIPGQPEKHHPPAVAIPVAIPAPVPRQTAPRPIPFNTSHGVNGHHLVHPHANPQPTNTYTPPPPSGYVYLPGKNGKVQAVATPPPQPYPTPTQPTKSHPLSLLVRLLKPRRNSVTSNDSKSSSRGGGGSKSSIGTGTRGNSVSPTQSDLPSRSRRRGSIP